MWSLHSLNSQISVNMPPLSLVINSTRSGSTTLAQVKKGHFKHPKSLRFAMQKLNAELRLLHDVVQSSQRQIQRLLPALLSQTPKTVPEPSYVSSQTFYENKTGFQELCLEQKHGSGCFHCWVSRERPQLLVPHHLGSLVQRREFRTLVSVLRSRSPTAGFGLNRNNKPTVTSDHQPTAQAPTETAADKSLVKRVLRSPFFYIVVAYLIFRVMTSTINVELGMGKPGADLGKEVRPEDVDVKFADVKGCDEVKEELQDVVHYLLNVEKYKAMGATLPKGLLLVGEPGVGKTLLAKATAGEARVPFFSVSGSEFDELFVGVGAKRIRTLFAKAKEKAPCIVFIDEIDSVGGSRTQSVLQPHANQTINQLLSEMDGFEANTGIIVIGATNFKETLDKALLRSGRFDMEITVLPPDNKGRMEILDLYLSKVKHGDDIDIEAFAKTCQLMTGADLFNIVNQAALYATKLDEVVTMSHLEYAKDKVIMGPLWKNKKRDDKTIRQTAYHEAGHALVSHYTEHADKVHKITILARGQSLGSTHCAPDEADVLNRSKRALLAQMDMSLGGRAADELIFGKDCIDSGASSDLVKATNLAIAMVTKLGMSEKVGLRVQTRPDGDDKGQYSPDYQRLVDEEIQTILDQSYKRAKKILVDHKSEHKMLAEGLLEYETLTGHEMKLVIKGKRLRPSKEPKDPADPKNSPLPPGISSIIQPFK